MNKKKWLYGAILGAFLGACSDSSSTSSAVEEVCDYDTASGYYFCKDENGNYSYAILPDGTTQEITTPDSAVTLPLDSATTIPTCTDLEPAFYLNNIAYYVENDLTFYYDASCNPVYLVEAEIPNSSGVESSSSQIESTLESSSSQQVIPQSSSAAVIYNPNGSEKTIIFSDAGVELGDTSCIEVTGTTVKITCGGDYYLSGNSSNFQVMVAASDTDKVYLYLNNLSLASSDAPIYVQNADKTFLMLIDGTTNTFTDASSRTTTYTKADGTLDTTSACIYAKDDLTIKGNGTLEVTGNYNNGIHTSNDIRIKDVPQIKITAKNHGIKGKGSVNIDGGVFNITTTEGDAIKSDEGETEGYVADKGYVQINGGEFNLTVGDDGIQAYNYVFIQDSISTPIINIKTGSGASTNSSTTSEASLKGIKGDSLVLINAGLIDINAADDGIHSNSTVRINGGDITIAASDDAIHGDVLFELNNGKINVTTCYEGFEAYTLNINGGVTSVIARDDAWNAAGGTDNTSSSTDNFRPGGGNSGSSSGIMNINGGYHYVKTPSGDTDGIDSNGDININGGVIVIEAGNNIIDIGGSVNYTAGIMLGFGKTNEGVPSAGNPTCFSSVSANTRFSVVSNSTVLSTFTTKQGGSTGIYINSNSGTFYTAGTYTPGTETFFGYGEGGSLNGGSQMNSSTCSSSGMGGGW